MILSNLTNSSFEDLKNYLLFEVSLYDLSLSYIIIYVLYTALGRYVYFKPQEHSSKINRTFLVLAILVYLTNILSKFYFLLPYNQLGVHIIAFSILIVLIAPLSILIHSLFWEKKHSHDRFYAKEWTYNYLNLNQDYYKVPLQKSKKEGQLSTQWEEEGIESTSKNIHSDALINVISLIIYFYTIVIFTNQSFDMYGVHSVALSAIIILFIGALFINNTIFDWLKLYEFKFDKLVDDIKKKF